MQAVGCVIQSNLESDGVRVQKKAASPQWHRVLRGGELKMVNVKCDGGKTSGTFVGRVAH